MPCTFAGTCAGIFIKWQHSATDKNPRKPDRLRDLNEEATGPLRQATGPPWSGARVGVGMLRGAGYSLTWKYKSYQLSISCFFDRYEIHIQDFEELVQGSSSFPGATFRNFNFNNSKFKKIQI